MVQGKTRRRTSNADIRTITHLDVWQSWRICPASLELRVRRLRWLQAVIRHPFELSLIHI
eukprot:1732815-Pyramimonas_sp.AAC.1